MSTKKTAIAALACLLMLLGCKPPPEAKPTPDQATAIASSASGAAPAAVCGISNTHVETCEPQGNKLICPIYVFSTPNGPVVFPHNLKVPPGREARIVWHLLEPKARFLRDDGPQELKNNSEFEQGSPTEDNDGSRDAGDSGRKYKFHYKNTAASTTHRYTIVYRSAGGQVVRCDPLINNSSN